MLTGFKKLIGIFILIGSINPVGADPFYYCSNTTETITRVWRDSIHNPYLTKPVQFIILLSSDCSEEQMPVFLEYLVITF